MVASRAGNFSRPLATAVACLAAFFGASSALAVAPNFTAIAPAGGQRGTSVEVTLRGDRLADAQEVFFYTPGITLEKISDAQEKEVKVVFLIAADCRLGEHALRIRTASGISALRLFYVGPFPSVEEKEPNNEAAKAQPIALNSTVQGTIGSEDVDVFSVEVKKDQRLSVEIEGARLGRTLFDPTVTVLSADGRVLAASDDTPLLGHDGFVSLLAPADGKYLIQVRDMTYAGTEHFYRLHLGTFPRPAAVFPLGGQPGETLEAKFLGDPTGDFTQPITLPTEKSRSARFGLVADHHGLAPSPNWLRISPLANAPSITPGNTLGKATALNTTAPLAFNGVLTTKGDAAFFRFTAKKDQNLDFQVYARRLGSPLDSVLTVFDAKGKSLGNNDDAAGNPDSAVRVKIPEDGDYTVKVADQLARGGPRFTYRVEIAEVAPTLTLSIPDTARYDNETRKSIVVPRGNRFAVLLNLNRDTFNGDLAVTFDGLPAGITALADTVPGSLSAVPVVFDAATDAPIAGTLLTPAAQAVDATATNGKDVVSRFRHTVDWVRIQNDIGYSRSEVGQIAAAVVEAVPFTVRIVEPKVPLVQSGEAAWKIIADRQEGFDEPITVKMLWNPPGVTSPPDLVIPKGASSVDYKLNASNKAEVRKWKTAVIATATVKGGSAHISSQLAELEIAAPFLAGKIDLTKVERGQTAKLVCKLEQKNPFAGTAVARLVGLPANTTASDVEITQDSTAATFEIVTTDKSPLGSHKNIFCSVTLTRDGEPITHLIAQGSVLRIDAARPKTAGESKPVAQAKTE
ncbi:MAG: peptidase [Opitutia bacterium]|nr:peptidase [Opitutaceae bacterium]PHX71733.1 MAG: peptidase [Opitutae bacterium]PHX79049.1 MAG: peptidase [Opitutae bacterium]